MISEGVTVINHSATWLFDGPGDGTSPSSISPLNTVDRAVAAGIVWVNAAGNHALKTWFKRGPLSYSTITVDGEEIRVLNFDGSDFTNQFHLSGPLQLRWNDTWRGATTDLDLLLVRSGQTEIELAGIDPQTGEAGHDPYESVRPTNALVNFDVLVAHVSGREPDWIQLLGWGSSSLEFNTPETGSIGNPGESASLGMLTVGAAHWNDVDTIRHYSSRGPTPDGRIKPDLVGADCGDTAAAERPFCGTSQASPHVAGMAALVRQRFPEYSPVQVVSYLKDNAQQRTSPDPNNTWGHGFVVLPPDPPQFFGSPFIDSVTAGVNSLAVLWRAPAGDGGSPITAYDLRHIESAADETVDSNWTVVEDVWTSGSNALSHELTGLRAGTQYNVQVRAVNSTDDGPWSSTVTGTPTIAETPCSTGGTVPNPHDNLGLVADCDTLRAVRDTLAGSGTLNWSSNTPITDWDGIEVGGTPPRVTLLYFDPRGLSGTIPAELGSLTGLTQLTIVDGHLTGPIPPELGSLTNLTGLLLFSNQLTGEIPEELGRLTNLQDLSLYDNQLTGLIPPELGNLTGLEALHLDRNQLTGPIPPELGSLTNLRWLTLHDNQLRGEIPLDLVRLTNLEQLYLSGNRFSDCVPSELRNVRETDRTHLLKDIGIPYCDVLLRKMSVTSAELRPEFDPYVTGYTAAATASRVTVSPTSRFNASFQYLDQNDEVLADADVTQAGHQVEVPVGMVTTIRVKVTTADGTDSRIYTIEVTGLGGLAAPSISQVTSGVDSLTVSWREPTQIGGSAITTYDLRHIRSDAPSKADPAWTVIQDVWGGSGALSHELTGLEGGVQYDIQVRAVNERGDGPWSASVTGKPRGTVPDAPTGLTATANGQTQVDLAWSAPLEDGGTAVTGYRIEVSPDGSTWTNLVVDSRTTTTSYSHTGLVAGTARHYRVSAINSEGSGPASNVSSASTGIAQTPDLVVDTPTVSDSAPTTGERITLSATVRNQGSGESSLTTLRYYRSTDSTIITADTEVGTDSVSRLDASESGDESVSLDAPSTPGTYYYGACVDTLSDESDTTNNCSSSIALYTQQSPSELFEIDIQVLPERPLVGDEVTISAVASGRGGVPQFALSGELEPVLTLQSERAVSGSFGSTVTWTLLASQAGSVETVIVVNYETSYIGQGGGQFYQYTNDRSEPFTVTVGGPALAPDLVVDAPTISESRLTAGARITLNATVRNQGNGAADSTTLRYYRSTDSTITTGDMEFGAHPVSALDALETEDESISLLAPSTAGTYYYGACVDAVSAEFDATNNCSSAVTVTVGAAPVPDLVVDTPTVSESTPTAGARFTLSATVRNQGNGGSSLTTLRYYQSSDSTITTEDTEVDTDSVSSLDASETGDESVSLTAPSTTGTYHYGACVDSVSDETDTANNCSSAVTVTVGAAPAPDLVVDTPTVSSSALTAGARITLSATVRNQGNGRSDSTTLRYYRSTDSTITTADTEVDTDYVSRLDASESGDESTGQTAPSTAGTYYYGACVDTVSDESDTTNNCSSAATVTVGRAPAPDLVVDTPTVSESAPAVGAHFRINTTVRNQGNGRSDSTTLRYYRSTDSTVTTADTEVDTDYVSRLDASESGDESARLTAPPTPGTYYYGVCVDAVSGETETTNNCPAAVAVTIGSGNTYGVGDYLPGIPTMGLFIPALTSGVSLSSSGGNTTVTFANGGYIELQNGTRYTCQSTGGCGVHNGEVTQGAIVSQTTTVSASDLIVGPPTVSESTPTVGGSFTLSATVRNQGNGSSAFTTLRYYSSTDSTITTGDMEVGTDSVSGLDTSESEDESARLTAPSAPGTYYYGACVDAVSGETDTTNNCSSSVTVTVGAAPAPDLVVDMPTVSESAPAAGARFTLNAAVRNQGNGSSSFTTVRYYRSTDSTITTGDTEVGTDSASSLDPSQSGDESISLTAPSTPGTYYYGACVDAVSGESDTTNNCSVAVTVTVGAAPAPDLVVDTPTVSESAPTAGASFTLSASARNQGNGSSVFTTLRYYQSTDSTITTGDTEVGTDSVSSLDAAESGGESISLTAPSTSGTYYYGACVDAVADESDTTNNCSAAVTVTVGSAPAPDLIVSTFTVGNSNPVPGQYFALNVTVKNQGNGSSSSTSLRYYRSTDATITSSDAIVPTAGTSGYLSVNGLSPSGREDKSAVTPAPSELGTYYYGVCVETVTGESDTTNNCSNAMTVTIDRANQPPKLTGDVDDKTVELGESFTVDLSGLFTDPDGDDITSYGFTYRTRGILAGGVNTRTGILSFSAIAVGKTIVAVDARDSNGQSSPSVDLFKVTVITAQSATKPGAPMGLTATADGQTEIDLSWTAPSDDGGAAITGYKIEVSTDGSSWSDLVSDTGSTMTSYSHTRLSAGSTRHYRVSAINPEGTGNASNVASDTTDPAPLQSVPTTDAVTGVITECSGESKNDLANLYEITIAGTLTAIRPVGNVLVTGELEGEFLGVDSVGDMAADATTPFTISSIVSLTSTSVQCSVQVTWLEIN